MTQALDRTLSLKLERERTLWASRPRPRYPAVSVTGGRCELNCPHCEGRYLHGMVQVETPGELRETCARLDSEGANGVLISGGFNREGHLPLGPFLGSISTIKDETDLHLSVHPGLMPEELIAQMADAGVDAADFDLVGDGETIDLVQGTGATMGDYERVLFDLADQVPHVAPHICLGLHRGEIRGERRALKIAAEANVSALVFLVIVPTPGTPFEDVKPPDPETVGDLISEARVKFPDLPISLGCMRPRGERRVGYEVAAVRAGVDRIELPTTEALEEAERLGLEPRDFEACCAVPEGVWRDGD